MLIFGLSILLPVSSVAGSATYYISPTGNDQSGDGTKGNPWKSLAKAVPHLSSPGDTLYCRGGVYTSLTDSAWASSGRDGTAAQPMSIRNFPGETPVFRSTSGSNGSHVLRIYGDYWIIDGLQFKPTSTSRWDLYSFFTSDGDHNIIRNCWFESTTATNGQYTANRALALIGQSNEVYDCTFKKFGNPTDSNGNKGYTILILGNYHHIHHNHFERGVHDNVGLYGGDYCLIRHNTFRDAMGYAILTQPKSENNLIEFNHIQGCGTDLGNNKNPFFNNGHRNVYRYNVGYDSRNKGVGAAVYWGRNVCVYNNAFWKGQVGGLKLAGRQDVNGARDHSWVNNIVAKYMQGGDYTSWYSDVYDVTKAAKSKSYYSPEFNNQFHNNWIQSYVAGVWESDWHLAALDYLDYPYDKMSIPDLAARYSTTWSGNNSTYSDPHLLDPDNGDFTITSGESSLVDAGRHLTTTVGTGSGTSMTLAKGGAWFFWPGDKIAIGSVDNVFTIPTGWTRGANPIMLTGSASWTDGQPVYLYSSAHEPETILLKGDAPDIGPYEFTHPD